MAAADVDLATVTPFSHGTTVATNALIARRSRPPRCHHEGFRDVPRDPGAAPRDDLWDADKDVSPPYIRRRDRFGLRTHRLPRATSSQALDEDEGARAGAAASSARGAETVAVAFIERLRQPGATSSGCATSSSRSCWTWTVSTSSETLPEIFEYERFSTTAQCVLLPLVSGYVSPARVERLKDGDYRGDLLLLHPAAAS